MVRVNKVKYINIYSDRNGSYIVHNTKKPFNDGHTHINNYNTAIYISQLVVYKRTPKNNHLSKYLYQSILRVTDDKKYAEKIRYLMDKEYSKDFNKK